jgi:tetratricopeptide (TPR) repeat protein
MTEHEAAPGRSVAGGRMRTALAIALGMFAALVVHGPSLATFFTSPDDLVYLEQAAGLVPTPFKVFRHLSEVLYFRVMFRLAGLDPLPYHVVTMALHLANIGLVILFARAQGIDRRVAAIAATLFGVFPLFSTVLSSAVGINDELALALALAALLALRMRGVGGLIVPVALFALALLSKESVVFLPLLAFVPGPHARPRGAVALAGLAIAALALLPFVRPIHTAGGAIYAVRFGANLFHNLMTYASWSVNVANPLPDLVSSFDPRAWHVGIFVVLAAIASLAVFGRSEPAIRIGWVWYLLGLLPVLPLVHLTYRHYLYPALPGLALAATGTALRSFEWLVRRRRATTPANARIAWRVATVVTMAGTLAYAAGAFRLVRLRFEARVADTGLALDSVYRRQEMAGQALASLGRQLQPDDDRVGILLPEGTERVFGARSGREYRRVPRGGQAYDLLEECLDHGRAVRLYFPWVDSVAFIARWEPAYRYFVLYAPTGGGRLQAMGSGPEAHDEVAKWMMRNGWYPQARDHLRSALEVYPSNAGLRLGYGAALFRTGDRADAVAELEQIVREAPGDSAAIAARAILAKLDSTRVR